MNTSNSRLTVLSLPRIHTYLVYVGVYIYVCVYPPTLLVCVALVVLKQFSTSVSHVPSCAGALPFLARHAGVSAATSSSSSGAGLPMSMSMTDVWLAADVGAPPGDAYLATGLFGIAAAVIAVGTG